MSLSNFLLQNTNQELAVRADIFRITHDIEGPQIVLITGSYTTSATGKPRHRLTTIGKIDESDIPYVATTSRSRLNRIAAIVAGDRAEYLGWTTVDIDTDGAPEQSYCRDIYYRFLDADSMEDSAES